MILLTETSTSSLVGLFITAYFVSTLSALSGIGGGGMLIPLYSIILDIDIKDAVFLSIITICGSSFIKSGYFITKRHKDAKNRYLSNFDIIRLIIPFDGSFAYLGFVLNKVLPDIAILVFIIILMGILIYKTVKKTYKLYKKKEKTSDTILIIFDNIESNIKLPTTTDSNDDIREGETKYDLFKNIVFSFLTIGLITFFTFVRDSYDEFSTEAWLVYLVQVIISLIFAYQIIDHIKTKYILRKKTKFNFIEGDIKWDENKNFVKYGIAGSFVGFVSTMLGIGGSMVLNPIMINLHVLPEVVVATSSISSFFSAVISSLQYIFDDAELEWPLLVLFFCGSFASLTGIVILRFFKKNIRLIITTVLCVSLITSLILLVVSNIIKIVDESSA